MADTTSQIAPAEDVAKTPEINQADSKVEAPATIETVAPAATEAAPENESTAALSDTAGDAPDAFFEDDDDIKSKRVTLADLSAKGTALYAHKSYEEATEIFSRASVLQAEINGETAPENAEILFHYGRSLFKVGQSKSDVLGGSAPTTEKKPSKSKANGQHKAAKPAKTEEKVTQEGVAIAAKEKGEEATKDETAKKPLFQFEGDENFDASDDEEVRKDLQWVSPTQQS